MELFVIFCDLLIFVQFGAFGSEEYRDLPLERFGSRYWKNYKTGTLSFDEAQEKCDIYGGSLAIFPTADEALHIFDLLAIDMRLGFSNARDHPILYWIGLKYELGNIYWVNSVNDQTIPQSKWQANGAKLPIKGSITPVAQTGCQAAQITWNISINSVEGALIPVACDESAGIGSFLCEKPISNVTSTEFWPTWGRWSNSLCDQLGVVKSTRTKTCYGYGCELRGLPTVSETRVCCTIVVPTVTRGRATRLFSYMSTQAYEGQQLELVCDNGFVHPDTRYQKSRYTCIKNPTAEGGQWTSMLPSMCVPVQCGTPPLGVHTQPPIFSETTYNALVSYTCQLGFRESKKNETRIFLKCGNDDTWVGLNDDTDIKPVCRPVDDVAVDWKHYPPNQLPTSGNDHCYQLNHLGQTWAEAVSTCNGNLLTILNDAEFQFVTKEILEPQAEGSVLWLAGRKLKDETQFSWYLDTNLTTVISGYTNWGAGGPYLNQYHRDLCIAANFSSGQWTWLNLTCDNKFEFICKTLKQKVDGMWSEWTEWSICDRHYRRQRSHVCDNPEPFCGGSDCHGDIVDERFVI